VTAPQGLRIFEGAVAIVTGGASGIGKALGEALAGRGCEVILADLQAELAQEVAAGMRARGWKAAAARLDVADFSAVEGLVRETAGRCGRLDYMFNNAGIGIAGELRLHTIEHWGHILDVNLRGVIHGIQAAYPVMLEQRFGHIVNTASMQGLMPGPGLGSYATTKYAVVGLSKSLRAEAASAGIRVSVLCPGVIRTPLLLGGKYGTLLEPIPEAAQLAFFERFRPMDPAKFAGRVLRQVARDRPVIIVPAWWKAIWWIDRAFPGLSLVLAQKRFEAMRKRLFEASRLAPD
jgi:NAD(P)-dependent dehydrogenase (short-subunit alcohol dehydrogenase family)